MRWALLPTRMTRAWSALALAIALNPSLPAGAEPAPQGEELLDADGYLGLKPGQPADEAAWTRRFGPPDDVESQGGPRPFRRLLWGISLTEEAELGLPMTGMAITTVKGPQGWRVERVELGAARHPRPLLHGQPLTAAEALEQGLAGALRLGPKLLALAEGLELNPPEDGAPQRYGLLDWSEPKLPERWTRTQALGQALATTAWPASAGQLQALMALVSAEGELPLVLVPARVEGVASSPEGPSFLLWRLRLEGPLRCEAYPGPDGQATHPPSALVELSLPRQGSLEASQPGDRVALEAEWLGRLPAHAGEAAAWALRHPRPVMLWPQGKPFAKPELWPTQAWPAP